LKIAYPLEETFLDYPDNKSMALIVYFYGCDLNCVGCQNPNLKSVSGTGGFVMDNDMIIKTIQSACDRSRTNKIVFSGGDPLSKINIEGTKYLLEKLQNNYDIMIYSGMDIDYIKKECISGFKFIKSGPYIQRLKQTPIKTNEQMVFGSKNQRLYDANYNLLSEDGIYVFEGEKN
jgi:organic radical activating enzyme